MEGKFIKGKLNGKGIFKNLTCVYEGEFLDSKKNGKGELKTKKYIYKGDFDNDKFNGNGNIEFLEEGSKYSGTFVNNEISGKGIFEWKNGDIYEGEMKKGKMDGIGKFTFNDGKIYEGEYKNGIKQGKGKLFYPGNKVYEGYFNNGLPDGEGIYKDNGKIFKVLFSKGKFIQFINDDNNKLIIFCENCGRKQLDVKEFNLLIEKNTLKICIFCYKSIQIKKMFYSKKCNNYICESCYSKFLKENTLDGDIDYTLILNSGKKCDIHKSLPILFFCSTCEKHICLECKVKHLNHKVINLCNETKKRNNIEEMKSMLMKEEKEIENEENFGKLLINTLAKTFENNAKNRKDLYNFKKILYQYFFNNNNYSAFKNIDFIFNKENNPDLFINEKEIEDIQQIINSINDYNNIEDNNKPEKDIPQKNQISNNINNKNNHGRNNILEKELWKRNSLTVIKQSKRRTKKLPSLPDLDTSTASSNISININNNNNTRKKIEAKTPIKLTRKKNIYYPVTPIKTQRMKNKKFIEQSNNMINRQISDESAEFIRSCLKVNLQNEQSKEEDMDILLRMGNSIINMVFVDDNKILISAFSPDKNLFLTELDRKKENDKYKLSLKLLSLNKIGEKPIIHMEICENGNILSYSEEKLFLLKIVNNLINIIKIIPNNDNNNISNENNFHILSCVSQGNNNILILKKCENNKNINELIYYSINNNIENTELTPNKIELPKSYKFTALEKIANDMCILIGQYLKNTRSNNNSKNVIK